MSDIQQVRSPDEHSLTTCVVERENGRKKDGILFVQRLAGDQRTLDLVTQAQLKGGVTTRTY